MELDEKIKDIRRKNNLSQEGFADLLGVSRQSVISWEKGKTLPQTDILLKICEVFHVNLEYFLDNTPNEQVEITEEPKSTIEQRSIYDMLDYKDYVIDSIFFDTKMCIQEFREDLLAYNLHPAIYWLIGKYVALLFSFIFLTSFSENFNLFCLFLVIYIVLVIICRKSKENKYIAYYCDKSQKLFSKEKYMLSTYFCIYLTIDDDIVVKYFDKVVFRCRLEMFEGYMFVTNTIRGTKFLNCEGTKGFDWIGIYLYVKGVSSPAVIMLDLLSIARDKKKLLHLVSSLHSVHLNKVAAKLKLIEEKNRLVH